MGNVGVPRALVKLADGVAIPIQTQPAQAIKDGFGGFGG